MRLANSGFRGPDFVFDHKRQSALVEWPTVSEVVKCQLPQESWFLKNVLNYLLQAHIYVLQSKSGPNGDRLPQDIKGLKLCLSNWLGFDCNPFLIDCNVYVENFFRQGRNPTVSFHQIIVSQICLMHLRLCDLAALMNKEKASSVDSDYNVIDMKRFRKFKDLPVLESIPEMEKYAIPLSVRTMTERDILTLAVECDLTWDKSWQALHDHLGSDNEVVDI